MHNDSDIGLQSKCFNKIKELLSKTSVEFNDEQVEKMASLVVMLKKWNKTYNLTAIDDADKMIVLHILDSAVVSPVIKNFKNNIADVGTGAGFPGLVLAILHPEKNFTLIDSIAKKLSFVRFAAVSLKLNNVEIINERCEKIKIEEKFDCILSRAFAPLDKIVNWCKDLIKDDGVFVAMKSHLEEKEINDVPDTVKIEEIISLQVPTLDAVRNAVILKKVK